MDGSRRAELLLPAGSLDRLKTAILYGADAVYLGTPDLSLRTRSEMTLEDVVAGVEFAHAHGKRAYLTLNLFSHNRDIDRLPGFVETIRQARPDGLIVADPGVFAYVRAAAPDIPLHISTQANVCSWQSVKFWQDMGADLVVLAREVSFEELREIREKCPDIRLEAFVHGAMCMTYSGRCLLSNFLAERGANQGSCANSCRWKYKLHLRLKDGTVKELPLSEENIELFEFLIEEEHRPGELLPIEEDERGSYILNSKDLNLMPRLADLLATGIDSLKVEGRGKSAYYVAMTARAYRLAIDAWYAAPERFDPRPYLDELEAIPNRGYTLAFHDGRLDPTAHGYQLGDNVAPYEYAGVVRECRDDGFIVEVKAKLVAGDVLEFVPPSGREVIRLRVYEFEDASTGERREVVQPSEKPSIRLPFALFDREDPAELAGAFPPLSVIRKERPLSAAQWARLKLDEEALKLERGEGDPGRHGALRDRLLAAQPAAGGCVKSRTPRMGVEGCCGRGCNGCLVFWHAPEYGRARALLANKRTGEKFPRNMREDLIDS
jgi:putative protease